MNEARLLYSWYGLMKEKIFAREIKSREDARKLGPFVDEDEREVHWRSASFDTVTSKRKRRSHFAHYPIGSSSRKFTDSFKNFDSERYDHARSESSKHRKAKKIEVNALQDLINQGRAAQWFFNDPRASDFSFSGNLLESVQEISEEYKFPTPFGKEFCFDVALLGPGITKTPILLAAVEIEFTHEFSSLKCLLSKALGFPIFSLDITEVEEDEISYDWCYQTLLGTTQSHPQGRRYNYIYLHDMLYPLYSDVPLRIVGSRHQFIIVAREPQFDKVLKKLKEFKANVGMSTNDNSILIQPVNVVNEQTRKMQANECSIAGREWRDFNEKRYIRIVLDRSVEKRGSVYYYHLLMTRFLNGHCDVLVGYKYSDGLSNADPDEPVWTVHRLMPDGGAKIMPKQVGQPVELLYQALSSISR